MRVPFTATYHRNVEKARQLTRVHAHPLVPLGQAKCPYPLPVSSSLPLSRLAFPALNKIVFFFYLVLVITVSTCKNKRLQVIYVVHLAPLIIH